MQLNREYTLTDNEYSNLNLMWNKLKQLKQLSRCNAYKQHAYVQKIKWDTNYIQVSTHREVKKSYKNSQCSSR
jgi:hypothetical protein